MLIYIHWMVYCVKQAKSNRSLNENVTGSSWGPSMRMMLRLNRTKTKKRKEKHSTIAAATEKNTAQNVGMIDYHSIYINECGTHVSPYRKPFQNISEMCIEIYKRACYK